LSGSPLDSSDQIIGIAVERDRKLYQRVDARHPRPTLQEADLGSVQLGSEGDRFLAEARSPAQATQVGRELLSDRHGSISRSR
jgi:hypothetical protein